MKKSLILVGMLSIGYAYAQEGKVGINTDVPSATLDVKAKTNNGSKVLELQNSVGTKLVTTLDNGNTGIGTETPTSKLEVKSNSWYPLIINSTNTANEGGGGIALSPDDFSKRIEFSVTGAGNLRLYSKVANGNLLFLDATNKYMGINKSTPVATLNVKSANGAADTDKTLLLQNASGIETMTVLNNGNVGIGTSTPTNKLEIKDGRDIDLTSTSAPFMLGNVDGKNLAMDNNEIMARNNGEASELGLQADGGDLTIWNNKTTVTDRVRFTEGKVGIGTITPKAKLDVVGNVKITDGTQSAGRVLTSDSEGNASWATPTMSYAYSTGKGVYNESFPATTLAATADKYVYTGMKITLPTKGKYAVLLDLAISSIPSRGVQPQLTHDVPYQSSNKLDAGQSILVKGTFWDEILSEGIDKEPVYRVPLKNKANSMWQGTLTYPNSLQRQSNTLFIENTSSEPKTFYFYAMAELVDRNETPSGETKYIYELASGRWAEESFVAFKIGE